MEGGGSDAGSDEDGSSCPLCCELLDATDRAFVPCACGYQICAWCWHQRACRARRARVSPAGHRRTLTPARPGSRVASRRAVMEVATKDGGHARCPACRGTYDEKSIKFEPPSSEECVLLTALLRACGSGVAG
jgi:CCR4-NOT transcription complex subunit 4